MPSEVTTRIERARAMANLRVAAVPLDVIAEQFDAEPEEVEAETNWLLSRIYDPKADYDTLRAMNAAQIDALLRSLMPYALDREREDHLSYNKAAREALAQKAKLLGLNRPDVIAVVTPTQEELQAVFAEMRALRMSAADEEADILALEEDEDGVFT